MGSPKVELDQAINPVFFLVLCSIKEKGSIPRLCQRVLKIMLILNRRIFQVITGNVTRFTLKKKRKKFHKRGFEYGFEADLQLLFFAMNICF